LAPLHTPSLLSDRVDLGPRNPRNFKQLLSESPGRPFGASLGNTFLLRLENSCHLPGICPFIRAVMATPSGSGGTSLAPTPIHPHHLSRETSRDEVGMAESLRHLSQDHNEPVSRTDSPSCVQQPMPSQGDDPPEIYHSLEDAVPISEGPAAQTSSGSSPLLPGSIIETSAPMSGQVCRYVSWFLCELRRLVAYWIWIWRARMLDKR
jgi:hypothetical protein